MSKGKKTGGRKKGSRNKSTRAKAALEQHAAAGGVEPLAYLLGIMRSGKGKQSRRDWAAAAAAPYVHAKKQSVQLDRTGPPTVIIKDYNLPVPKITDKPAPLRLVKKAGVATVDD